MLLVPAIKKKQNASVSLSHVLEIQPCFSPVTIIDDFLSEKDIYLVLNQNSNVTWFWYIEPDLSDAVDLCLFTNEFALIFNQNLNLLHILILACNRAMLKVQERFKSSSTPLSNFVIELPCQSDGSKYHNVMNEPFESCKNNTKYFQLLSSVKELLETF